MFGRKEKLSPRFIGPYWVVRRIGPITYQLELPSELSQIHNVFHVSMLRQYRSDPSHVVVVEEIDVRVDLTFEEKPIQIIGHEVKVLRRKPVPLVKVMWHNHKAEEATWEPEEAMRHQYPQLFGSGISTESQSFGSLPICSLGVGTLVWEVLAISDQEKLLRLGVSGKVKVRG
ncbi:uncharacterized protein LOC108484907 [Gossypium arboreum]|uniref:uncharacterized protein LOC108484907 n=1 Tax=Gossypium arboreum TaxID=29729 RepID=UPI000819712A|nr:uncharacterized protein LOC108484907 [Gossypium arboreum]